MFLPRWELVALELTDGLELVGEELVDDATLLHLRGSVNHLRAIFENQRRVLTEAGITSFGSECSSIVTPIAVDEAGSLLGPTPSNSMDVEEDCRELTFEGSLERQEPDLSFYDEHPGTIDVWVVADNSLIQRIELGIPPDGPVGEEDLFTIEYSLFNEVEIEAP